MTTGEVVLRPAVDGEAPALSELAVRSKAHWGYDPAFLERVRADLAIAGTDIHAESVVVAEHAEWGLLGFYQLVPDGPRVELARLFVEPAHIGAGFGTRLWQHALGAARARGCTTLWFEADPNAESFYRRLGAAVVGQVETAPGRWLPIMMIDLWPDPGGQRARAPRRERRPA